MSLSWFSSRELVSVRRRDRRRAAAGPPGRACPAELSVWRVRHPRPARGRCGRSVHPGRPPGPAGPAAAGQPRGVRGVRSGRRAPDRLEDKGGDTQLVVVNPTFILGPALTTEVRSSLQLTKMMLDGRVPAGSASAASLRPRLRNGGRVRKGVHHAEAAVEAPEITRAPGRSTHVVRGARPTQDA